MKLDFRGASDYLMDFRSPTWAAILECYQYFEHSDRDDVRVVQVVEGPSVQLLCRGNTDRFEFIKRALPSTACDADNMDRSGRFSE
jgi:hypothetical protein